MSNFTFLQLFVTICIMTLAKAFSPVSAVCQDWLRQKTNTKDLFWFTKSISEPGDSQKMSKICMQMNLQKVQCYSTQSSYIHSLEFACFSNLSVKLKPLSWFNILISATHQELLVVQEKLCTALVLTTVSLVSPCRRAPSAFIWTENTSFLLCTTVEQFLSR